MESIKYPGGLHGFTEKNKGFFIAALTDEYIVDNPRQIKSADPVTYDDDGHVIPLSKRFDFTNPDIRY